MTRPNDQTPRLNLQVIFRWAHYPGERCAQCQRSIDYGAKMEGYMPLVAQQHFQTEEEEEQAVDDYCNTLANQQEAGNFTMHSMQMLCSDCASDMILETVGIVATIILAPLRKTHPEGFWIAQLLLFEPGAYGRAQPFTINGPDLISIEQIYARGRQSRLSDEERFEIDEEV